MIKKRERKTGPLEGWATVYLLRCKGAFEITYGTSLLCKTITVKILINIINITPMMESISYLKANKIAYLKS